MAIMLSLLFSGCTSKVVIQKEFICYDLQDMQISDEVEIRTHPEDENLFKARKGEIKDALNFYVNQNREYRERCNR